MRMENTAWPRCLTSHNALEPLYDEKTLRLHYTKHHAPAVTGLNEALQKLAAARKTNDYRSIQSLCDSLALNGSSHVLHTLFWHSLSPDKPQVPDSLAQALNDSFGSVPNAQSQFAAATKAVEGSGWGVLVYEPIADKLLILQCEKHQNLTIWNTVPYSSAMCGSTPTISSTRTTGRVGWTTS